MNPTIITHGLKVAGALVGGGMTAGVGVAIASGAAVGYGVAKLLGSKDETIYYTITCPHCGKKWQWEENVYLAQCKGKYFQCTCSNTIGCG